MRTLEREKGSVHGMWWVLVSLRIRHIALLAVQYVKWPYGEREWVTVQEEHPFRFDPFEELYKSWSTPSTFSCSEEAQRSRAPGYCIKPLGTWDH